MTTLAHIIAVAAFAGLVALCLALDKRRHQYFRDWQDERANAAWWRALAAEHGKGRP
jgi:hypothetical protein